ncbi:serum response factor-binding protein 1 [Clupea harengus]|uniref:Serum response factor-binding protein 1 n=1 Tax=Clupea harengus TaxID=7950 RepID=A0A6P3VKE3_CLUHA|nr:serum response factor-binding protein 1 [Clupea harengus]
MEKSGKEIKMPTVLNLSNEVVKMRSEVKKVKVFIIRKLTRQMTMLKKKKGKEEEMQRNQRRAARLLEEMHEIKILAPDTITKAALQKDINFEKVCQDPEASISGRAIARIATHPQFSQRIQSIKDRIKAFKDERTGKSKEEKTSEKDKIEIISEKQDDTPLVIEEVQATAGEVTVLTEKQDENDNPPSEGCVTGTDITTASQTKPNDEAATVEQTSTEGEKVPAEVVRMRKEVKKIRVLIISKLTNQMDVLKRKKCEPSEVEDNQQKTFKLLKEIQVLRSIQPDHMTKAALLENANLEKVGDDPDVSPLERATARIITHPRFIKKLEAVKAAVQEEERKAAAAQEKKKRLLDQASLGENSVREDDDDDDNEDEDEDEGDDNEETEDEGDDNEETEDEGDNELESDEGEEENEEVDEEEEMPRVSQSTSQSQVAEMTPEVVDECVSIERITSPVKEQVTIKVSPEGHSVVVVDQASSSNIPSTVVSTVKPDVNTMPLKKNTTASPAPKHKQISNPASKTPEEKKEEEKETGNADSESDLESSEDEEKPYFDDSTEERFHKQSSMEESDDNDFFIGKVSKFKKKKKNPVQGEEKTNDAKKSAGEDTVKSDFKHSKFESVFCNALSRGRGGSQKPRDGFGGRPPRFQKQMRQPEGDYKVPGERRQNQDYPPNRKPGPSSFQSQKSASSSNWGRTERGSFGAGRGKQPFDRRQNQSQSQRGSYGKTFNSSRQTTEALHPSWEASRKRKEQISQITAFQGKKIKFDDD